MYLHLIAVVVAVVGCVVGVEEGCIGNVDVGSFVVSFVVKVLVCASSVVAVTTLIIVDVGAGVCPEAGAEIGILSVVDGLVATIAVAVAFVVNFSGVSVEADP